MDCFIKKVWQNKEGVHAYFIRFSRGHFKNRAVLNLQKTTRIKLKGSFEWANDFVRIASELADIKFSGIILNKEELPELAEFPKKKKTGIIQYEIPNISSEKIKQIEEKAYCMLLDGETPDLTLKMKKKLPKPGKSNEKKADDKFCQLEADLKYWPQIKEAFMLPECKKCKINHAFIIEELILPEGEKDFVKIRELTKRKGKIIRNLEIDKQETKEEKDFVA
jgi:hypothetical protein